MAAISTLAVSLIARTSSFERGMKRSRSSLRRFQQQAAATRARLASMAKGLLLAAGVGGMGFMIKRTLDMIDATAKLSDRLGITTERLIGLRHAANIAGVSTEALDKGLSMFIRRLGEVKLGTGEAKEGLKLLGLSADELIRKSPADAVAMVAEKIKRLESASLKGQAAYLLFGRAGQQLLNMFEMGAKGLAEMQEKAEQLGKVFGRFDAKKVEDANDAITDLKGAMQGLAITATIKLAPMIERLASGFVKYKDSIISTIGSLVKWAAKTWIILKVLKMIRPVIMGLIAAYKGLAAVRIVNLTLGGPAGWVILAASVAIATGAIIGLNEVIDKTAGKIKSAIAAIDGIEKTTAKIPTESIAILAKIAEEKKLLAKARALDREHPGFKLKITIDIEKRIGGLVIALTKARHNEQLQLERDHAAKVLAIREKLEKSSLARIEQFGTSLRDRLEDIKLGAMEGSLARLERAGKGLAGRALDDYTEKLQEIRSLVTEIAKREEAAARITKDVAAKKERMDFRTGQFQQIRSAFVDVSALGGGVDQTKQILNNQLAEAQKTNILLERQLQTDPEGILI